MTEGRGAGGHRRRPGPWGRRRPAGRRRDGHPSGVLLVCAVVAGTQMTWGLVVPVLPVYADELDAGPAALGVVVAAFGLGRLLIDLPAGALAGRMDGRRLLALSVALVATATLATALVPSIEWLVAARLATGLAGGVAITTGQALLAGSDPERLGRTMGALQAYQLAGGALGPVLGGVLVGVDPRLPFVVGGGLLLVLAAVTVARRVPQPHMGEAPVPGEVGARPPLWTPALAAVSVVGFTVFFVRFGGQQYLFPLLAYEEAGLSPAQLGTVMAATTVLGLVLVRFAGALTDRRGRRPVVLVSTTALGLTTLGFLGSGSAVVFVGALVLTGVATAFTGPPTGAYLASSVAPQRRGMAVGVYRTFGDAATLVGPVLLGWLLATGDASTAVVTLALTTLAATAVFAVLSRTTAGGTAAAGGGVRRARRAGRSSRAPRGAAAPTAARAVPLSAPPGPRTSASAP